MMVRPEGQFNTVVYYTLGRYRNISGGNFVLMNKKDKSTLGVAESVRVTVKNARGTMTTQKELAYPIKEGNILVSRDSNPQSKMPSFKSIEVTLEKE
jgi:anaerobic selenocysteine-containing dehydrogenase